MRRFASAGIVGALAVAAALAGTAGPALAASQPQVIRCTAGYEYYNIANDGTDQYKIGPLLEDHNGGKSEITESFTATVSGSLSVTVSGTATFDISIIVADAKAALGVSVAATLTGTEGTTGSVPTPAGDYALGQFGIFYYDTWGDYGYSNGSCVIQSYKYINSNIPHSVGFNMWTSKTG